MTKRERAHVGTSKEYQINKKINISAVHRIDEET